MPSWDQIVAGAQPQPPAQKIATDVNAVAPLASTYTTQNNLGTAPIAQMTKLQTQTPTLPESVGQWAGQVAGGVGSIVSAGAKYLFDAAVKTITAPVTLVNSVVKEVNLSNEINTVSQQAQANSDKMTQLSKDYQAGKINQQQYKDGLNQINTDDVYKRAQNLSTEAQQNAQDATQSIVDVGLTVVSVLAAIPTGGGSIAAATAAKVAAAGSEGVAETLAKQTITDRLASVALKINTTALDAMKLANKVTTFNGHTPAGAIFQLSQEAAGSATATMTSAQIAKQVAVNVLLKKPIIYQTNLDLAKDIYKDMAKGDIGGATQSAILTATMALAGGPIGYGLEALSKTAGWLKAASYAEGNVGKILKAENATNIANGNAARVSEDIIKQQAKTSVSQQSFIDALSAKIGNGDASQIYRELLARSQKGDTRSYEAMKVMEEVNMKQAGGNSVRAASFISDWYNSMDDGLFLRGATAGKVIDDMINWKEARDAVVNDAINQGMKASDAERIVIGRANSSDLGLITNIIKSADDAINPTGDAGLRSFTDNPELIQKVINTRLELFQQAIDRYGRTTPWANSSTFIAQVEHIIRNTPDTETMTKAIQSIKTGKLFEGVSDNVKNELSKRGYFAIMPEHTHTSYVKFEDTNGILKTAYKDKGAPDYFQSAVKPIPVLQGLSEALTRSGLSFEASQDTVQKSFQQNFATIMEKEAKTSGSSFEMDNPQNVLTRMYDYVRNHNASPGIIAPITDLRQMRRSEIMKALNVSKEEANTVMKSVNSAMLQVPYSVRGLGDRILDYNMKFNPVAAQFSRVQGAARFTFNPFFRWQQSYQTETLAQLEAGGKIVQLPYLNRVNKVLFGDKIRENEATIKMLEDKNIFGPGFSGIGSSGDIQGKIGTRILHSEKVSLAGLIQEQARKLSMTPGQYVDNNYNNVIDTLRAITGNNHTKDFFDSPLARTLNTAFFPFRYNLKMANLMAGYVGRMSAPTQVAMIYSLMKADQWLKSDDGIAWQSQYSSAVQLFNWLSPTYPLSYVVKLGQDIVHPEDAQISDLGMLGGMPFGMITQILEANGIISTGRPYMNPTTGEVYAKYVPQTQRAQVNLALQSFLGALFTYPGAMLNLPSKGSILRNVSNAIVGGGKEFTAVPQDQNLTPDQQHQQQVIQAQNAPQAAAAQPTQPPNTVTTVPATKPIPTIKPVKSTRRPKTIARPMPK